MVPDYIDRVYGGVLGKIIGVYLGRPFEGWTYERITAELGEITDYIHDRFGVPLVVTDDDITGTFTFLRALPDHGYARDLTPAQIGETWLNYILENRTILWWGGLGRSTEHTAYLRLKRGIEAPRSGSIALNGRTVAEQIGAQIFIDGWAMVAPGDPAFAADLARRAASVSHDGEAIHAAQVIAAMEAQAFVESDIHKLLDTALSLIPRDSLIARLIEDLRDWHAGEPDWRKTRARIAAHYGYDKYGGNCHVVPNHAVILLSVLYGGGDFSRSLMIANTSGWDTDCNSGNVGCLLGIRNGWQGIEARWRDPVMDRLYLPTADGGRAITDAVIETYHIVNTSRALAGQPPLAPKQGARYHFELPGAMQGFRPDDGSLTVENVAGHSRRGSRSLALRAAPGRVGRVATDTFIPPDALTLPSYTLLACPTLYAGQTVLAGIEADANNAAPLTCRLYCRVYDAQDNLVIRYGPEATLSSGATADLEWRIETPDGAPIAKIGIEVTAPAGGASTLYLDFLTWDGAPAVTLIGSGPAGKLARRAWVDALDRVEWLPDSCRLIQNEGTGLLIQGTRDWTDTRVRATITPHLAEAVGIAARVQGLRRYYALLLCRDGVARLVRGSTVLAEMALAWEFDHTVSLELHATGSRLMAWVEDHLLFEVDDSAFEGGGAALILQEGCMTCHSFRVGG